MDIEVGGIIGGSYRCPRLTADLTGRNQDAGVGTNDILAALSQKWQLSTGEVGVLDLQVERLRQSSNLLLGKQKQDNQPTL